MKKNSLHPKNPHCGKYDFKTLGETNPQLKKYIIKNKYSGIDTIDFSNNLAVKFLNKALLEYFYHVKNWDLPLGYLCPPIPGRADYIHFVADLMGSQKKLRVLDIGTGANGVYPFIGVKEYDWNFVATDIDPVSLNNLKSILDANENYRSKIELRLQSNSNNIFTNIISEEEHFDLTICNPPFHASKKDAELAAQRKISNLKIKNKELNFGGQNAELFCQGGEAQFIKTMILESRIFYKNCRWFTTLVSKKENLSGIYGELKRAGVKDIKTVNMSQGQKESRFVGWTF